jgi:hypothetical protein
VTGRLLSGKKRLTGPIELAVEPKKGGAWGFKCRWEGTFKAPAGFQSEELSQGASKLTFEMQDGAAVVLHLLSQDESGEVSFHCPGAPEVP